MTQTPPDYQARYNARAVFQIDPNTGLAMANDGSFKVTPREVLAVTNTAAAGAACTLTIPAGAAAQFTYLASLQIVLFAAAAMTGAATPTLVTTTNIPGNPVFSIANSAAGAGLKADEQKYEGAQPIKGSAAATAITIVAPVVTNGIWRINATYFLAS